MSYAALAAAIFAGLTCLIHLVLGGRDAARPLLNSKDLQTAPKLTNYYCWHIVTIVLALMSAGYAYLSQTYETGLAWGLLLMSVLFTGLSLGLIVKFRVSPFALPQWILFAVLSLIGMAVVSGY